MTALRLYAAQLNTACFKWLLCVLWHVQYLTQPEAVLQEAHRVLRPGGSLIISFTKDFFSTKALAGWIDRTPAHRCTLVSDYAVGAGFTELRTTELGHVDARPMWVVQAQKAVTEQQNTASEAAAAGKQQLLACN
jgi:Methyltransferase domain